MLLGVRYGPVACLDDAAEVWRREGGVGRCGVRCVVCCVVAWYGVLPLVNSQSTCGCWDPFEPPSGPPTRSCSSRVPPRSSFCSHVITRRSTYPPDAPLCGVAQALGLIVHVFVPRYSTHPLHHGFPCWCAAGIAITSTRKARPKGPRCVVSILMDACDPWNATADAQTPTALPPNSPWLHLCSLWR